MRIHCWQLRCLKTISTIHNTGCWVCLCPSLRGRGELSLFTPLWKYEELEGWVWFPFWESHSGAAALTGELPKRDLNLTVERERECPRRAPLLLSWGPNGDNSVQVNGGSRRESARRTGAWYEGVTLTARRDYGPLGCPQIYLGRSLPPHSNF